MNEPTHILLVYPNVGTEMLFRAVDGICLGQASKETVIFGDEPNKRRSHVFMNHEKAAAFLRNVVPMRDLSENMALFPAGTEAVEIEERNAENVIVMPSDADALKLPGGINAMRN